MSSIVDLVREAALDAELAALLWLLVEGDLPLVVTGGTSERREAVLSALDELPRADAGTLADESPSDAHIARKDVWGPVLRARISALRPGDRFRATAEPGSLLGLLEMLEAPEIGLTDDEIRALGLVVVLDEDGCVGAVHLLRPVERDAAGHLQRRPPAVLAARDRREGALEHFTWAVTSELSDRVDRSQADFEARHVDRTRLVDHLAGHASSAAARPALDRQVASEPPREPAPQRPPARPPWPDPDNAHRPH